MLEVRTPLSNLQIELLKLYSADVPEQQLHEIKLLLGNYFAHKATDAMDLFCAENSISGNDMTNWANGHDRVKNSD